MCMIHNPQNMTYNPLCLYIAHPHIHQGTYDNLHHMYNRFHHYYKYYLHNIRLEDMCHNHLHNLNNLQNYYKFHLHTKASEDIDRNLSYNFHNFLLQNIGHPHSILLDDTGNNHSDMMHNPLSLCRTHLHIHLEFDKSHNLQHNYHRFPLNYTHHPHNVPGILVGMLRQFHHYCTHRLHRTGNIHIFHFHDLNAVMHIDM